MNTFKGASFISSLLGHSRFCVYKPALVDFRQSLPSVIGPDVSPTFNRDVFWSMLRTELPMAFPLLVPIWDSSTFQSLLGYIEQRIPFRNSILCH